MSRYHTLFELPLNGFQDNGHSQISGVISFLGGGWGLGSKKSKLPRMA